MADRVTLIPVASDEVEVFWPYAEPFLRRAIEQSETADDTPQAIKAKCQARDAQLYLVVGRQDDGPSRALAAAYTQIEEGPRGRVCWIMGLGGEHKAKWLNLLDQFEALAEAAGCAQMRVIGRKGWMRDLPDYRLDAVVLVKNLGGDVERRAA